jgi:hypothetical protein
MKKEEITIQKVKNNPAGGVLIGKDKEGQTIIPNDGSLGGFFVGKLHKEGGIKAVNMGNGQPIEVQSNEIIITAPAVADQTKNNFNGKMMTNREVLSKINVDGGGVSFADGGEMPKSIKHTGASYKYGGKTMTDHEIMTSMNSGGHLAEGFSLRDIADIHQVPLTELKKQVRLGMEAESEHTSSKREQMKIVKDHLFENPKYYTLLKKVGLKKGGEVENLVKDAKSGNSPSRDLNNYNDLLDVQTDGAVGAETGLFADGGGLNKDEPSSTHTIQPDGWGVSKYRDGKEIYKKSDKNYSQEIFRSKSGEVSLSTIVLDSIHGEVGNRTYSDMKHKDFDTVEEAKNYVAENYDKMEVKKENEIESNLLDNQSFEEFKHSLEYVSKLDLTEKGNKNLAIDVQVEFFRWFVKEDLNANLKSYYEAIEILPKNKREYCFELFERDDLFEKLDKNVFYYLPENLKKEPKVKKIDFAPTPSSQNLAKITDLFTDKEMLRPIYSGVNFNLEDEEIEVTNAHILLLIKEKPHVSESGVYVTGKTKEWYLKKAENTKEDSDGLVKLEGKYPLVQRILPNEFDFVFSVDAEKFLRYANASEYFSNEYTNQIVIGFKSDDERISSYGVSANLLASCLKAMLMLGYNEIDVCLSESKNRAICLVPKGNSRKVSQRSLTTDLTLLMPMILSGNESIMDNIYDLENDMPSTRSIMLNKELKESVLEQEKNISELEPIEAEKTDNNEVKEAIEVLELLSETAEGEDKKEIDEAIEILQMLLETSSYELGGKISNDDFTFRKIETPLN